MLDPGIPAISRGSEFGETFEAEARCNKPVPRNILPTNLTVELLLQKPKVQFDGRKEISWPWHSYGYRINVPKASATEGFKYCDMTNKPQK